MEKQLQNLNVLELKALCYDQISLLEQTQNNLRILNQELNLKLKNNQQTLPQNINSQTYNAGSIQPV